MAGKGTKNTTHKRKDAPATEDFEDSKRAKTVEDQTEGKNTGNVIGGYKATLKNPNASDEAKEHAKKMIEEMGGDVNMEDSDDYDFNDESDYRSKRRYNERLNKHGHNIGNVIGGYKATLSNENASDEAKEHAKQMIEELESHQSAGGHLGHVANRYKSQLKDEKASDKDKSRASKVLEEFGADDDFEYTSKQGDEKLNTEGKDITHVIAGFKSTLSNDKTSDEAKEHAKKMLEELEGHQSEGRHLGHAFHKHRTNLSSKDASRESKDYSRRFLKETGDDEFNYSHRSDERYNKHGHDLGHVIGGYKATLSNEKSSEEAKENARRMLEELGSGEEPLNKNTGANASAETVKESGHYLGHVIGGYKATLSNEKASEEAKDNARHMLEELGAEEYEYSHKYSRGAFTGERGTKNFNQVMGGFKATLHNPNSSEEAKEHARQMLKDNGVDEDSKLSSGKDDSEKNPNNVIGGLKAALNNSKTTDAAREDVSNKLAQMEKTAY